MSHFLPYSTLQSGEVSPQSVFPANLKAAWEVVHLLVFSDGSEGLGSHVFAPVAQPPTALCKSGDMVFSTCTQYTDTYSPLKGICTLEVKE